MNLGADFSFSQEKWKELADRIETIISGQLCMFPVTEEIEQTAQKYAKRIICRHGQRTPVSDEEQNKPDFQTVDINTLENEQMRSVGAESVVLTTIKNLELDKKMASLGFNRPNIEAAIGVITARLLAPASEYATHTWLQHDTSLDDLMDTSFESLSQAA